MPKTATADYLDRYPKLSIKAYRDELRRINKAGQIPIFNLNYTHNGKQYEYSIQLTGTPCYYGGLRYWWNCPNCDKRVGVLYCAGLYVCRHCIGANYKSQLIQPIDKHFKRIAELRQRLGWHGGLAHGMGDRPRYMHHKTYEKLEHEYILVAKKAINATFEQLPKNEVQ